MSIQRISKQKLHSFKKLNLKKFREEEGTFLIEGSLGVLEALQSDWQILSLFVTNDFLTKPTSKLFLDLAHKRNLELFEVLDVELETLTDVVTSQGIAAIASQRIHLVDQFFTTEKSLILALDRINDPGNLGTIIRTSDWFGVDGILTSENSVDLYSPKVVRASMGSMFHLPIVNDVNLVIELPKLKQQGFTILSASVGAKTTLSQIKAGAKTVIVLGSESHGISEEILSLSDTQFSIPKYGKAESLNVAIACGVVLGTLRG